MVTIIGIIIVTVWTYAIHTAYGEDALLYVLDLGLCWCFLLITPRNSFVVVLFA